MKKRFLAVLLLAVLLAMSMAQAAWAAEPANKVLAYTETNFVKYNYGIVQDFQQEDNTVTLLGDGKVYEWDITSARVKKGSVVVYTRGGENMLRAVYSFDKYGALTG